jgi:hypothetical protein
LQCRSQPRKIAAKNVTLEEINKEIEDYRKGVAKNEGSLLSD